jgi:hypothetical protein
MHDAAKRAAKEGHPAKYWFIAIGLILVYVHVPQGTLSMPRFRVDGKITFGDILTFLGIVGSVGLALLSWHKDRSLTQEEHANKIRAAASATLTKLDRWKAISVSTFDDVEPLFVDTKEDIRHHHDIEEAKHTLWKNILTAEITAKQKILDEDIASGYTDLSSYAPKARVNALKLLERLNAEETPAFADLLENTQGILDRLEEANIPRSCFNQNESGLYNSLTLDVAQPMRIAYEQRLANILKRAEDALTTLVNTPTPNLLSGSARQVFEQSLETISSQSNPKIEPLIPKDEGQPLLPRTELDTLIKNCKQPVSSSVKKAS